MCDVEAAIHAIAAPRRRAVLLLIRQRERSAGHIASHVDVTRPAISQHLVRPIKAARGGARPARAASDMMTAQRNWNRHHNPGGRR